MNKIEEENIFISCKSFKNILIDIYTFCDLLSNKSCFLDPITDKHILSKGYYANLFGARVFVTKNIGRNHICFSMTNDGISCNDCIWSPEFNLNDINFKRYIDLKAFW